MRTAIWALFALMLFPFASGSGQVLVERSKKGATNVYTRIDAPTVYSDRTVLGKTSTGGFSVTFTGSVPGDVQSAVNYAKDIWSYLLTTSQTVNIEIKYESLGQDVLAETVVSEYRNDFTGGQNQSQYPMALVKQLNSSITNANADMTITIGATVNWHTGTDGVPEENKYDLVSVILHEIGHGLGIAGSMTVSGANGSFGLSGFANTTTGLYPKIYDRYGFGGGGKLVNQANPSSTLGSLLLGGNVFFDGTNATTANNGTNPKLYAPATWEIGSSFSHLDEETYKAGNTNSMFSPQLGMAEVIHTPGEIGLAMLKDLGWNVNRMIVFKAPAPTENIMKGSNYTVRWYDNIASPGGNINLALYKVTASGTQMIQYINPSYIYSVPGFNNSFVWQVPTSLTTAEYFIKAEGTTTAALGATNHFKISDDVTPPVFSPAGGQYTLVSGTSMPVELSTNIQNGVIRYTLNGIEPTTSSTIYTTGQPIYISSTTTIKAKTFLTLTDETTSQSTTSTAIYNINTNSYYVDVPCISGTVFVTSGGSGGESTDYLNLGITKDNTTRRGFLKPTITDIQAIPDNAVIQNVEVIVTFSPYNISNINVSFKDVAYDSNPLTFFDNIGSAAAFDTKPSNSSKFDLQGLKAKIQSIASGTSSSLVIGLQSSDESNSGNLLSGSTYVSVRIFYRGNVEVSQLDKNNNAHGPVYLWESNAWQNKGVGFTEFRNPAQPITLKGDQNVKTGTTEKWKVWSDKGADNFVNFNTFSLNSTGVNTYISKFDAADNTITIHNTIDGVNAGTVQFSDPWYIDYTDGTYGKRNRGTSAYPYTRTVGSTGFKPDGTTDYPEGKYNGVFLNQNNPSYTVNAPAPPGAATFLGWSVTSGQADFSNASSPSTGVVFKQTNTTIAANYKAHLFSGSSIATAGNNQRKIIKATYSGGKYCMVYESVNRIFLTTSTNGTIWSNEIEISDPVAFPGLNKYPSIVNTGNNPVVVIVWQRETVNNKTFSILKRTYHLDTGNRSGIEEVYSLDTGEALGTIEAKPVIAAKVIVAAGTGEDHYMIAWKNPNDGIYVMQYNGYFDRDYPDGFYPYDWSQPTLVPGTSDACFNPSIIVRYPNQLDWEYCLCWEDQSGGIDFGKIMYMEALHNDDTDEITFTDGYQVSPDGWYLNQFPSMVAGNSSTGGTRPTVVWQSMDNVTEGSSVHFRQKFITGSGTWDNTITSFSMGASYQPHPVVSNYIYGLTPSTYHNISEMVWTNGNDVYSAKFDIGWWSSSWNGPSLLTSGSNGGSNAAILPYYYSDSDPGSILKVFKNSNNNIKTYITTGGGQTQQKTDNTKIKTVAYRLNKHVLFNLESDTTLASKGYKGMIAFEIAGLGKQTSSATSDVKVDKEGRRIKSDKITVSNNTEVLKLAGAYYAKGLEVPKNARLDELHTMVTLQLKDASTDEVVKELWSVPFSRLALQKDGGQASATKTDGEYRTMNIPLNGLKGREVYLDVTLPEGFEPTFVDDYYMFDGEDEKMKKFFAEPVAMPTEYALHQNYPNPFNPSTTIRFDLVEPQYVAMKIYNSLGQEVKELVNEYYSAGSHEVTLNASSLSSGAYFYRITAGKFTAVKSFMLVK